MTPDSKNTPPTAQTSEAKDKGDEGSWIKRAGSAYRASTSYIDSNMRKSWDDAIRAFNSQHPTDSKYNTASYEKRSKLYRPKTRSVMRKNEAASAAAFFSNMDVVDVNALNQGDRQKQAGAECMKQVLQCRLTKSVPWFQVIQGGLQDAQTTGVVCAHAYWEYKKDPSAPNSISKMPEPPVKSLAEAPSELNIQQPGTPPTAQEAPETAEVAQPGGVQAPQKAPDPEPQVVKPKPLRDQPVVDLIPVENIRIDPGANWMDPINSSPYVIHMIPMYVMDVMEKMESGEWRTYGPGEIRAAADTKSDSTRSARQKDRNDQYASDAMDEDAYVTVWIQRHIHRKNDVDWEFYLLGENLLLTTPVPLKEVVFHGMRPYVMGCVILETHKVYPSGIPMLGKNLQDEANEVANQRIDNVKFVLNKKWFIKRGKDVDVQGLVRNVPGGVVSMDDPVNDVREISWPDVTQSAYEEQSRIDNDLGDLLGNFSPAQVMADHGINGPARNMSLLNQSAGTLVEYLLRTYVETFVQPLLRQIMALEQHYETDQVIISVAANKAKLLQKYGISEVTDQLLDQELVLNVNVGMGATDPQMKLQRLTGALNTYAQMAQIAKTTPGLNIQEIGKEVFGCVGYADGTRFFTSDDPQVAMLQGQLQESQKIIEQLNAKVTEKMTAHQVKVEVAKHTNETKVQVAQLHEEAENLRSSVIHHAAIVATEKEQRHEAMMATIGHRMSITQKDRENKTDGFKVIKKEKSGGSTPSPSA
jgi:hypothetical protein